MDKLAHQKSLTSKLKDKVKHLHTELEEAEKVHPEWEGLEAFTVFLQQFAAFSRFFGEAVEKVECGAVWIHCRLGDEVVFG